MTIKADYSAFTLLWNSLYAHPPQSITLRFGEIVKNNSAPGDTAYDGQASYPLLDPVMDQNSI